MGILLLFCHHLLELVYATDVMVPANHHNVCKLLVYCWEIVYVEIVASDVFMLRFTYSLKPVDIQFMKELHHLVNIIPVIAKADTLTPTEVRKLKLRVSEREREREREREGGGE